MAYRPSLPAKLRNLMTRLEPYQEHVEYFKDREPGSDEGSARERGLIFAVRDLLVALDQLLPETLGGRNAPLGLKAEYDIKRLREIVRDQLERWGWDQQIAIDPELDKCVGKRLREIESDYKRPFLKVNLSLILEGGIASADDASIRQAEYARAIGLKPSRLAATKIPNEWRRLRRRWFEASILGKELPKPTPNDTSETRAILERLRSIRLFDPDEHDASLARHERESREIDASRLQARVKSAERLVAIVPKLDASLERHSANKDDLEASNCISECAREIEFESYSWQTTPTPDVDSAKRSSEDEMREGLVKLRVSLQQSDHVKSRRVLAELRQILGRLVPDAVKSASAPKPSNETVMPLPPGPPTKRSRRKNSGCKRKQWNADEEWFYKAWINRTDRLLRISDVLEQQGLIGKVSLKRAKQLINVMAQRKRRAQAKSDK